MKLSRKKGRHTNNTALLVFSSFFVLSFGNFFYLFRMSQADGTNNLVFFGMNLYTHQKKTRTSFTLLVISLLFFFLKFLLLFFVLFYEYVPHGCSHGTLSYGDSVYVCLCVSGFFFSISVFGWYVFVLVFAIHRKA